MPISARLLSIPLRISELAFAAIVAGLVGHYIRAFAILDNWPYSRSVYTEVIAGLSIIFALIWLLPFTGGFLHYPIDLFLSAAWLIVFAVDMGFVGPLDCGHIWRSVEISQKGMCEKWKAAVAFSFLSALLWLLSALVGLRFIRSAHRDVNDALTDGAPTDGNNAGYVYMCPRSWMMFHTNSAMVLVAASGSNATLSETSLWSPCLRGTVLA
ncbi:MAG: hypothetical protein LQ347_005212 [Umbilicaria vellea]|nr:MAG: hypothetical protein LQ347_005212 [Umbilicaria vellea]